MGLRRAAAALATAVAVSAAAPAGAAERVVATEQAPFTAAVDSGHVAWSGYDPATRTFALKVRLPDGRVYLPPVPPRGVAFDVDLGPGPDGLAAVYSRCAVEGPAGTRDCDLHRFDFRTQAETPLDGVSGPRDEGRPSIRGTRIAFARRHGTRDVVYTADLDGRRLRRQPAPAAGVTRRRASFVELGRELAVVYVTDRSEFSESVLWRIRNGRRHQVWDTRSGGANLSRIVSPGFSGRFLYFAETNVGSGAGNRIYRQSLASGRLAQARGSSQYTSIGRLGNGGFAVARSGLDACDTGRCTLSLTGPVRFRGL